MKNSFFVQNFGKEVSRATSTSPYFASVLIAQAILESNWGKSVLSTRHNNFYGLKAGSKWKGETVNMATGEVFSGNHVTIHDNFRKYDSPEASIHDRIYWMYSLDRYKPVATAKTPEEQARALQLCGYATDPHYAKKIIDIINEHNLKRFDQMSKNIKILNNVALVLSALILVVNVLKTVNY